MIQYIKFLIVTTFLISLDVPFGIADQSSANTNSSRGVLEEVFVTARKRSEDLQSTPVAVSALSGDDLREAGISNAQELTKFVPSLRINEIGANQIYIRGVGQRSDAARVDPAVSVYLDDIFLPRADGQLLETIDVESVQVLRGPQGTLFGKNNTGGSLIFSLVKPQDETSTRVEASLSNYRGRSFMLVANRPLTDSIFVRAAFNTTRRDGFAKDIGTGKKSYSKDRDQIMFQLRWLQDDDTQHDGFFSYGRKRESFAGFNCRVINENALLINALGLLWPGDTDPTEPRAFRENCESNSRETLGDLETNMGFQQTDQDLETLLASYTFNKTINETTQFKFVVSGRKETEGPSYFNDSDGGPGRFVEIYQNEDSPRSSYTVELQWNQSIADGAIDMTAGFFWMTESSDESIYDLVAITGADSQSLAALAAGMQPEPVTVASNPPLVAPLVPTNVLTEFSLNNRTVAAYSQFDWAIREDLILTVGGRYTEETRRSQLFRARTDNVAFSAILGADPFFNTIDPSLGLHSFNGTWDLDPVRLANEVFSDTNGDGGPDTPLDYANAIREKKADTFRKFTPMTSLSWHIPEDFLDGIWIDNAMVYATWSSGFKSGFFEPQGADGLQRIEPEILTNQEIGLKFDALERSLRINLAMYLMEFEDMQLNQVSVDSQGSLVVAFFNAGKSEIDGIELEFTWLPTPRVSIGGSLSINNYKFTEFNEFDLLTLAVAQERNVIDRTNENFPVSPEKTASAYISYRFDTFVGQAFVRLDGSYTSQTYQGFDAGSWAAAKNNPKDGFVEAYALFDIRVGVRNEDDAWQATLFAKNINDTRYLTGSFSAADSVGAFIQMYGEPRIFGIELSREF